MYILQIEFCCYLRSNTGHIKIVTNNHYTELCLSRLGFVTFMIPISGFRLYFFTFFTAREVNHSRFGIDVLATGVCWWS